MRAVTSRQARIACFLLAVVLGGTAQLTVAHSASLARSVARETAASSSGDHHQSAVVPVNRFVQGAHAVAKLWSVPLAGMLALVALLAGSFIAATRRRERRVRAVVTCRRRGPPVLQLVV